MKLNIYKKMLIEIREDFRERNLRQYDIARLINTSTVSVSNFLTGKSTSKDFIDKIEMLREAIYVFERDNGIKLNYKMSEHQHKLKRCWNYVEETRILAGTFD